MPDLRTTKERRAFNPEKHYLGVLCLRGHAASENPLCSWRNKRHGNCVVCTRNSAKEWRDANLKRSRAATAFRDAKRPAIARRKVWPFATYIASVRARALVRELDFDLDTDDLKTLWKKQDGKCYWTGALLDFNVGASRHPLRPSLDRLNPCNGYVLGNVVWSSNFANRARGELPTEEFATIMQSFGFAGDFTKDFLK